MTIRRIVVAAVISAGLLVVACEKPPGPGGRASVKGKVFARDFDKYAMTKITEFYIGGENVYICYGNDNTVGNNVKTSGDGSFEFRYLNKGHYKIFVLSRDTSIHYSSADKEIPVSVEFDIDGTRDEKDIGDLIINK